MKITITTNFDLNKIDIWEVSRIGFYNSGQKLQQTAQANAPYQTWKLKQSIGVDPWKIDKSTKKIRVWPRKVVYAIVREFVNNKNPDRKFYMRRTYDTAEQTVKEEFEKALKIVTSKL